MNKKNIILLFIFLLILPFCLLAKENSKSIEYVGRETQLVLWQYNAINPILEEQFDFNKLLTLNFPPSSKVDTIFFELNGNCRCYWSGDIQRKTSINHSFRLINPNVIPEGIEVWTGMSIFYLSEENKAGNVGYETRCRCYKFIMSCDRGVNEIGHIYVTYGLEGDNVPEEEAISIINALIHNGFEIEIRGNGTIQGVESVLITIVTLELTQLSKN